MYGGETLHAEMHGSCKQHMNQFLNYDHAKKCSKPYG